jgi:hypothetical protein
MFWNPGVKSRRRRDQVLSGLTLLCFLIKRCWRVSRSEGSRVCRISVCTLATPLFSVPGSDWVIRGTPVRSKVKRIYEHLKSRTYHSCFGSNLSNIWWLTVDWNLSTRPSSNWSSRNGGLNWYGARAHTEGPTCRVGPGPRRHLHQPSSTFFF